MKKKARVCVSSWLNVGWKEAGCKEAASSIRKQGTAVNKGHSVWTPPPSHAEKELVCVWWCLNPPAAEPECQPATVPLCHSTAALQRIWQPRAGSCWSRYRYFRVGWRVSSDVHLSVSCCNSLEMGGRWRGGGGDIRLFKHREFLSQEGIWHTRGGLVSSAPSSASFGGLHPCGPSVQAWTEAERMLPPDREPVRRRSAPPRPGPLHAVLWAGPSPESTASICEFWCLFITRVRGESVREERLSEADEAARMCGLMCLMRFIMIVSRRVIPYE